MALTFKNISDRRDDMNDYSAPLQAKREQLLTQGVLMMDPAAVYVEDQVEVGAGTMLLPGTILRGRTVIG